MMVVLEGRTGESESSEPRRRAGEKRKPQALLRGGPELRGVNGMSPSSTLRPGKFGLLAKGWEESSMAFEKGYNVTQILVYVGLMGAR